MWASFFIFFFTYVRCQNNKSYYIYIGAKIRKIFTSIVNSKILKKLKSIKIVRTNITSTQYLKQRKRQSIKYSDTEYKAIQSPFVD